MVPSSISGRTHRLATLSLIVAFGLIYLWVASRMPDGEWDAFAIWNVRAKFLAFAADPRMAFDPALSDYSHLDYPILLPSVIALLWKVTGYTTWVPIAVHGTVLLMMIWLLRGSWVGMLLAGFGCLAFAATQLADLPLALCLLAAVVAYRQKSEVLTGVMLGLAIHVKNEGALIALVFFVVWCAFERRIPFKAIAAFVPFLILLVAFKIAVQYQNDLANAGIDFAKLIDRKRYMMIRSFAISHIVEFGNGALALLMIYAWATHTKMHFTVPLVTIGLVFLGYIVIYLNTPQDLSWHLSTSFDRLVLHLFPTLVYEIIRLSKETMSGLREQGAETVLA